MGPLFSAFVAAVLAGFFALAAYAVLRIVRRKPVPFLSLVGVAVGGGVGTVLAVLVLAPFFAEETIDSGAAVFFYLSSIVIAAIVYSIVGLKLAEGWRTWI